MTFDPELAEAITMLAGFSLLALAVLLRKAGVAKWATFGIVATALGAFVFMARQHEADLATWRWRQ